MKSMDHFPMVMLDIKKTKMILRTAVRMIKKRKVICLKETITMALIKKATGITTVIMVTSMLDTMEAKTYMITIDTIDNSLLVLMPVVV